MILRKTMRALIVMLLLVGVISCAGKTTESKIVSIEVDAETIIDDFDLDDFELSQIKIILTYSDGTSSKIPLTAAMLSTAGLAKLATIGTHTITVTYEELDTSFTITLAYPEVKMKMYLIYQLAVSSSATTLTFDEWIESIKGEDGIGIIDAYIDIYGHLVLVNSEYDENDVGRVVGEDGKQVVFRINADYLQWKYEDDISWLNLLSLDELKGETGLGIASIEIGDNGEIIVTYTDDSVANLGNLYQAYTVQFKDIQGFVIDTQLVLRNHSAIAPEAPDLYGYIFTGWNKNFDNITEDLVVTAIYLPINFSITFEPGAEITVHSIYDIPYNTSVILPIPDNPGYVFLGWFLGEEPNSMQFFNESLVTQDLVLFAKWALADHMVTFLDYDQTVLKIEYVTHNASAAAPPNPSRLGYNFTGWDIPFIQVTSDLTVTAQYTLGIYTVFFAVDGGNLLQDFIDAPYGSTITLPVPTRQDYDFVGWSYQGAIYTDEFIVPPFNCQLYAVWADHIYHINFDANTGNPVDAYDVVRFTEITSLPTATKTGFTFEGWLLDGELVTLPFTFTYDYDITLTALWSGTVNYLSYFLMDGYAVIAGYSGSFSNLTLPDMIEGIPITHINDQVFASKTLLANVVVGQYVTHIGNEAFKNCSSLTTIALPASATVFGTSLFYGANNLSTITLSPLQPNELKYLFGGNIANVPASLTKIIFASGTTNINKTLLQGDSLGITIQTAADMPYIPNDYFKDCTSLTSVILTPGITAIGSNAFVNTQITSILIPNSVGYINNAAFRYLTTLTSVEFESESTLTSIGYQAFEGVSNLMEITLPASLTSIGSSAFANCSNLRAVYLEEDNLLSVINGSAFMNDMLLDYFGYAPNLTSIGGSAFFNCDELEYIFIPDTVTYIGLSAFSLCYDLVIFAGPESMPTGWNSGMNPSGRPIYWGYESVYEDDDFKYVLFKTGQAGVFRLQVDNLDIDLVFPNSVNGYLVTHTIARSFIDNTNIQTITLPYTIHEIGQYSFYGNSNLTDVYFSGTSNLKNIGHYAFYFATSLTNFTFPAGLESIGIYAFRNASITEIFIPNTVTVLNNGAFADCSDITSIIFEADSSLTKIGLFAFQSAKFEYIEIPDSVTEIGNYAFANNTSLTSIIIPSTVTTIGLRAFSDCYNLNIYAEALSAPAGWHEEWNLYNCPIAWGVGDTVVDGNLRAILLADQTYAVIQVLDRSVTSQLIPSYINIYPVTSISKALLRNMPNLVNLTTPFVGGEINASGPDGLLGYMFGSTSYTGSTSRIQYFNDSTYGVYFIPTSLSSVNVTDTTTIYYGAFSNCTNLTTIIFNAGITYVGKNAVVGCLNATIYSHAAEEPEGWDPLWNPDSRPVVWGY